MVVMGYLMGRKIKNLLIDDKPSKTLQNPKWSGIYLESFRGELL
jgi:hypothetical protein